MLSVGIDVGTTTTQLIFSRLILGGGVASGSPSPFSQLRSAGIVDKEVVYRSGIHFTPLTGPDEIDAAALEQILKATAAEFGIKAGPLVHPVRYATTGAASGPSLYHLLEILGRDRVLQRLDLALAA